MALIFEIKVVPCAGRFEFVVDKKGELKCYLKAAPEHGYANKELIKGLAKLLKVTQQDVEIIAGLTVRKKKIKVHTALTFQEVCQALGVPFQENFPAADAKDSCSIK